MEPFMMNNLSDGNGYVNGVSVDSLLNPAWRDEYDEQEQRGHSFTNTDSTGNVYIKESASQELLQKRARMERIDDNLQSSSYVFSHKPIIDTTTRNKSFLFMSDLLRELGISNHSFMLYLYDAGLQGVDPFADNLTQETKDRILIECLRNPMYVLREITRVSVQGGVKPFELHIGNLTMAYLVLNNANFYLEQPRQTYKTGSLMKIYAMIYNFGRRNGGMMLTHHVKTEAMNNLAGMLDTIELYPPYLNFLTEYDAKGNPKKFLKKREYHIHPVTNSKIDAIASARDPKEAYNKGRGKTLNICHYDEAGFIPYVYIFYAAATPAFGTAKENAKANHLNYGIHMTCTPPDTKTPEGEWMRDFVQQTADFTINIFDMSTEDLHEYININSENGFIFCSFQWFDLGLTKAWLEDKRRSLSGDLLSFRRDYLLEWIVDLTSSPFDEDDLRDIKFHIGEGQYEELLIDRKWLCKFYVPIKEFMVRYSKPKSLIIGLDFAAGHERDASAIVVVDAETTDLVMTFKSNKIDLEEFGDLIILLTENYFKNALLVPERNAYGENFIAKLRRKHSHLTKNLYFQYIGDNTKQEIKINDSNFRYGIWNHSKIRSELFETLKIRVGKFKKRFKSLDLYDEIIDLVLKPNGRIDHKPGKHDDLVMAYLWAVFALTNPMARIDRCGFKVLAEDHLERLENEGIYGVTPVSQSGFAFTRQKLAEETNPIERERLEFIIQMNECREQRTDRAIDSNYSSVGLYTDDEDEFYEDDEEFYDDIY
jgi:hypothetical protein